MITEIEEVQEKIEYNCDDDIRTLDFVEKPDEGDFLCDKEKVIVYGKKSKFDNVIFDKKIKVYVQVNSEGFITDVESELFLSDKSGWIEYDEGQGDRFAHAKLCYFDEPLIDEMGNYRYKR